MNPQGNRALVLGGTSGIGLAAVKLLAGAGAQVHAMGRSAKNIDTANSRAGHPAGQGAVPYPRRARQTGDGGICSQNLRPSTSWSMPPPAVSVRRVLSCRWTWRVSPVPFAKLWGYVNSVRLAGEHLADGRLHHSGEWFTGAQMQTGHVRDFNRRQCRRRICEGGCRGDRAAPYQRGIPGIDRHADVPRHRCRDCRPFWSRQPAAT